MTTDKQEIPIEEVTRRIQELVDSYGGQRQFAINYGCHESFISNVLHQRMPPSRRMLALVGLQRESFTHHLYTPLGTAAE